MAIPAPLAATPHQLLLQHRTRVICGDKSQLHRRGTCTAPPALDALAVCLSSHDAITCHACCNRPNASMSTLPPAYDGAERPVIKSALNDSWHPLGYQDAVRAVANNNMTQVIFLWMWDKPHL